MVARGRVTGQASRATVPVDRRAVTIGRPVATIVHLVVVGHPVAIIVHRRVRIRVVQAVVRPAVTTVGARPVVAVLAMAIPARGMARAQGRVAAGRRGGPSMDVATTIRSSFKSPGPDRGPGDLKRQCRSPITGTAWST
jgi:hypothetical protein